MSTIDQERLETVRQMPLGHGSHDDLSEGLCVMEAVAYVAGEAWSDHPQCASPTISSFLRTWNDGLPDDETRSQLLAPLIPRLVGTAATPEIEERRGYLALDWMIRVMTPAWLELAGLKDHAATLRELVEITDLASAQAAGGSVRSAKAAAWDAAWAAARDATWDAAWAAAGAAARDAAWDAARDATWDAARDAVRDAARDAVRDAAWDAAWAAAKDAAGAAARDAAGAAARDAAWDAARDAARDAAWAAARDATWDAAWAAAGAAARDELDLTVKELQQSALELIDRMIGAGTELHTREVRSET